MTKTKIKKGKKGKRGDRDELAWQARWAAVQPPSWFQGCYWQREHILSPGAAYAWDNALAYLEDDMSSWDDWSDCLIYDSLPRRFRPLYDDVFKERFLAVLKAVHAHIIEGAGSADFKTPAEEIAVRVLSDTAVSLAELNWDMNLHFAHRTDGIYADSLRAFIVEDIDVNWLFEPEWDGIEDDDEMMEKLGYYRMQLRFENWFSPYRVEE